MTLTLLDVFKFHIMFYYAFGEKTYIIWSEGHKYHILKNNFTVSVLLMNCDT